MAMYHLMFPPSFVLLSRFGCLTANVSFPFSFPRFLYFPLIFPTVGSVLVGKRRYCSSSTRVASVSLSVVLPSPPPSSPLPIRLWPLCKGNSAWMLRYSC